MRTHIKRQLIKLEIIGVGLKQQRAATLAA